MPTSDSELENLLTKGAIAEIPPIREGFFSRLFLVPKKGGTFRPVIDLEFPEQVRGKLSLPDGKH